MSKSAIITGITGQDGSYLAELLLKKGYAVHGIIRRCSVSTTERIEHLLGTSGLMLHEGDLGDSASLLRIVGEVRPDEIYNLAAQSHVAVSFDAPEYTANVTGVGTLRLLEAIRSSGLTGTTRFYQASTSELYGLVQTVPQTECTPFYPRSPYAVSKLFSYWMTVNYREAYGMYACNGILFNHESPRRGLTFVTRKITSALCNIAVGLQKELLLGNMDALRDWGHARDYVQMQWLMLQQDVPDDYVIATGRQITVREFVRLAAAELGIELAFEGEGLEERAVVTAVDAASAPAIRVGDVIVAVEPRYFRPAEVQTLLGNPGKAREKLGWVPQITLEEMVREMMAGDYATAKRAAMLAKLS